MQFIEMWFSYEDNTLDMSCVHEFYNAVKMFNSKWGVKPDAAILRQLAQQHLMKEHIVVRREFAPEPKSNKGVEWLVKPAIEIKPQIEAEVRVYKGSIRSLWNLIIEQIINEISLAQDKGEIDNADMQDAWAQIETWDLPDRQLSQEVSKYNRSGIACLRVYAHLC